MMTKTIKTAVGVAGIAMLLVSQSMAGGVVNFNMDNTSSQVANFEAPFYINGSLSLVGNAVQVVAFQGGSNYVLATTSIGQAPTTVAFDITSGFATTANGLFDVQGLQIQSNVLQGAIGSPMGFLFYAGATPTGTHGTIENANDLVPTPDWASPPLANTIVEADTQTGWTVGPNTTLINGGNPSATTAGAAGYNVVAPIPEPSSLILVGAGLMGLLAVRRRKS